MNLVLFTFRTKTLLVIKRRLGTARSLSSVQVSLTSIQLNSPFFFSAIERTWPQFDFLILILSLFEPFVSSIFLLKEHSCDTWFERGSRWSIAFFFPNQTIRKQLSSSHFSWNSNSADPGSIMLSNKNKDRSGKEKDKEKQLEWQRIEEEENGWIVKAKRRDLDSS
jgi:hypothetical protein